MWYTTYRLECPSCNHVDHFSKSGNPYKPEDGCHRSTIHYGWCNSCNSVTHQHSGQAAITTLSDYGISVEYADYGGPNALRSFFGGEGLPWIGVDRRTKDLKELLNHLILTANSQTSLFQRIFQAKKHKKLLQKIHEYSSEIQRCESLITKYKSAYDRALQETSAANEFFRIPKKPRCLACGSFEVRIGSNDFIPHSCGAHLKMTEHCREHSILSGTTYYYYNNEGVVVRSETKSLRFNTE